MRYVLACLRCRFSDRRNRLYGLGYQQYWCEEVTREQRRSVYG
jgi:hypothetical protein